MRAPCSYTKRSADAEVVRDAARDRCNTGFTPNSGSYYVSIQVVCLGPRKCGLAARTIPLMQANARTPSAWEGSSIRQTESAISVDPIRLSEWPDALRTPVDQGHELLSPQSQ
jgi:hypothetical protein